MDDEYAAKSSAIQTISYVEMAQDTLRYMGYFISDALSEFATPGGVENLRRNQRGEISAYEYNAIVSNDIATDAAASSIGAIIGGAAGGAAGFATGPAAAAAIPTGAALGAAKGATVGYVASRAAKAIARATVSAFRGKSGYGQRTVREYGKGRYWDGLRDKDPKTDLVRLARKAGNKGEIKKDAYGFFYRFDPAHKLDKVHLHKYKHLGGNKYKLIEEVDPETGNTIRYVNGDIEIWG